MPIELRPEVQRFAEAMEQKLRANKRKGGWEDCSLQFLFARTVEELGEFARLFYARCDVLDEAADVANFLMMICDRLKALKEN